MIEVAFFFGIATAVGGISLATLYLLAGGARRPARDPATAGLPAQAVVNPPVPGPRSRWSVLRVAAHGAIGGVAVAFLGLGAVSTSLDRQGAAIGAVLAVAAAGLGLTLFAWWRRDRRRGELDRPEQHLPFAVVLIHGVSAAATVVLAVLALATL